MAFNSYKGVFLFGTAAARPATPANGATQTVNTSDAQTKTTLLDGLPVFYFETDTGAVDLFNPLTSAWVEGAGGGTAEFQMTSANAVSPTAPASTSAYKMQGIGAATGGPGAFKPTATGRVKVTFSGSIIAAATTAGDGILLQASYGTGTAPANAATLAGTQFGGITKEAQGTTLTSAADKFEPFVVSAVVTGLTVGTAYWFDLAAESLANVSNHGLSGVTVNIIEF